MPGFSLVLTNEPDTRPLDEIIDEIYEELPSPLPYPVFRTIQEDLESIRRRFIDADALDQKIGSTIFFDKRDKKRCLEIIENFGESPRKVSTLD